MSPHATFNAIKWTVFFLLLLDFSASIGKMPHSVCILDKRLVDNVAVNPDLMSSNGMDANKENTDPSNDTGNIGFLLSKARNISE